MSEHLFKNLKLTIISDSGMEKSKYTYLFEPVFREINNFCKIFTHVQWVGFRLKKYNPIRFGKSKKENSDIFYINHFDKKPLKKRLKKYRNIENGKYIKYKMQKIHKILQMQAADDREQIYVHSCP